MKTIFNGLHLAPFLVHKYIYIHNCTYSYTHVYIYAYISLCMCVYVCIYTHAGCVCILGSEVHTSRAASERQEARKEAEGAIKRTVKGSVGVGLPSWVRQRPPSILPPIRFPLHQRSVD